MKAKIKKQENLLRGKRFFSVAAVFAVAVLFFLIAAKNVKADGILDMLGVKDAFLWAINMAIFAFFKVAAFLLGVAGMIFNEIIKPENVYRVLDNPAIYESWKMLRDLLNIAFIFVLLFSAFCTIFQAEKYHLKKVLLWVVIMALLVNFSFPVSRFIIDASNVTFYFILNSMLQGKDGNAMVSAYGSYSGIVDILKPIKIDSKTSTMYLITIFIFTLIFAVTLLVLAVLFVIRLTALGILIILSAGGFVCSIFPSTKHLADSWWSNLFKYSFFAPIMIFMMATSIRIMHYAKEGDLMESFIREATNNVSTFEDQGPNVFGSAAFFAIPIVLLWAVMIVSQKLSIIGANLIVGKAKSFAGWAKRLPWRGVKFVASATGISGGIKQAYDYYRQKGIPIRGKRYFGRDQREEKEAKIGQLVSLNKGWESAEREIKQKRIGEREKELNKFNVSATDAVRNINEAIKRKDEVEAIANVRHMIDKDMVNSVDRLETVLRGADADLKEKIIRKLPKNFTNNIQNDDQLREIYQSAVMGLNKEEADKIIKSIDDKFKEEKNVKVLVDYEIRNTGQTPQSVYQKYFDRMSAEDFAKQKGIHEESYMNANPDFQYYIYNKSNQFKQKAMSEMSDEGIQTWTNKGIV